MNAQTIDTNGTEAGNKGALWACAKPIDHLIKGRLGEDTPGKTRSLLLDKSNSPTERTEALG